MFVFNKFYNKHQNVEPGRTRGDDNYGAVQEQETLESRRAAARTQYNFIYIRAVRRALCWCWGIVCVGGQKHQGGDSQKANTA